METGIACVQYKLTIPQQLARYAKSKRIQHSAEPTSILRFHSHKHPMFMQCASTASSHWPAKEPFLPAFTRVIMSSRVISAVTKSGWSYMGQGNRKESQEWIKCCVSNKDTEDNQTLKRLSPVWDQLKKWITTTETGSLQSPSGKCVSTTHSGSYRILLSR